jgi:poly(A) polymerase
MPRLAPRAIDAGSHPISQDHISAGARYVCQVLHEAGYAAYLVGGCVRDLLLDLHPKDFDVATSATPEQIHAQFRGSRIVGRRFKIVHVRRGREIVEVTTFRAHHDSAQEDEDSGGLICPDSGMLLTDNVYGDIDDDALRRDFTINSLFYDPIEQQIIDYTGGLDDLDAGILRVIGDPEVRFREDPVRMLRAVRFVAKLDMRLDDDAERALRAGYQSCSQVAPARLFDEVIKVLMTGCGARAFDLLRDYRLYEVLFPDSAAALADSVLQRDFVRQALVNTDERIHAGKPVTPAFLYASLLWPAVAARWRELQADSELSPAMALREAAANTLLRQQPRVMIPRRFATPMREIWELHWRLMRRRRPQRLLEHPRFRAAYDFILLREQAGEDLDGAGSWWTDFQEGHAAPVPDTARKKRRRRRPRTRAASG